MTSTPARPRPASGPANSTTSSQPSTPSPGVKKRPPGSPAPERHSSSTLVTLWRSSIGKKWVMAVTGLLMVAYLLAHMIGNLKIFFGAADYDGYAEWLRHAFEPALHAQWFLWATRVVMFVAVVAHVTAAAQLSKRDLQARPVKYAHGQRPQASYATRTMRYGGIILALFIVWHILDLSAGVVHPGAFHDGAAYNNVLTDFQHWWSNVIYIVAMVMLGFHINHGFWSASQTLGINSARRDKAIKATGSFLAVVIAVGFIMVPVGVMTGIVH